MKNARTRITKFLIAELRRRLFLTSRQKLAPQIYRGLSAIRQNLINTLIDLEHTGRCREAKKLLHAQLCVHSHQSIRVNVPNVNFWQCDTVALAR